MKKNGKKGAAVEKVTLDAHLVEDIGAFKTALRKRTTLPVFIAAITMAAMEDAAFSETQLAIGEIYDKVLSWSIEDQKVFTTALCKQQGIDPPTYELTGERGRPTTGRNELAYAIYGKVRPELLEKRPGMNDSRAGLRITAARRAYRDSLPAQELAPVKERGTTRNAVKKVFTTLWPYVETPEEAQAFERVLTRFAEANHIEVQKLLTRWEKVAETTEGKEQGQ